MIRFRAYYVSYKWNWKCRGYPFRIKILITQFCQSRTLFSGKQPAYPLIIIITCISTLSLVENAVTWWKRTCYWSSSKKQSSLYISSEWYVSNGARIARSNHGNRSYQGNQADTELTLNQSLDRSLVIVIDQKPNHNNANLMNN